MKPSKAVIAGAAVTGSMAARAYAASASSHAGVSLQTLADPENRYQKSSAKGARVVANIWVGTPAKEKEAAQPMEASQSSNQVLAIHIGGCLGQGTASVLSR
jgi:hypothetical protein